ncbi:MAG: hypothetical protein JSR90_16270, partial [Proteobacteria bacterium]|nr:hypothetical protein [Pseudomonadota bacterium]
RLYQRACEDAARSPYEDLKAQHGRRKNGLDDDAETGSTPQIDSAS